MKLETKGGRGIPKVEVLLGTEEELKELKKTNR